jgi:Protein tyrosine/serine phosphatase
MTFNIEDHHIPLEGTLNVRDLGGYPTAGGGTTKKRRFFRADSLHDLTPGAIDTVIALGVTTQIDMRSAYEVSSKPSGLFKIKGIHYQNIGFFDNIQSSDFTDMPQSMTDLYSGLLDQNSKKYAAIFRVILESPGGCIFNCTAGKDRTGILAMLLLNLAGVEDSIIVADYAVSAFYIAKAVEEQKCRFRQAGRQIPDYIFASEPESMRFTLDHLRQTYQDAKGYLNFCGLSDSEADQLKMRLTD